MRLLLTIIIGAFGLSITWIPFSSANVNKASHVTRENAYNYNDARYCITAIKYYERVYQIPQNLLYAISVVESGRWNDLFRTNAPWPWAVNVEGEAFYFPNKAQAVRFIKDKLANGIKSMDVGCNQINTYHHGYHFKSVEDMINPIRNAQYAAQFLRENYNATKNWTKAVAWYHSKTSELGNAYVKRVRNAFADNFKPKLALSPNYEIKRDIPTYTKANYDNAYHINKYSSHKRQNMTVQVNNQKSYKTLNDLTKKVLKACE